MLRQSFWALAAAACFSTMAAFVKLCNSMYGPLELVFYRSLFTAVFLLVVAEMNGYSLKPKNFKLHLLRDSLGMLSVGIWFFTLGKLPLGTNITLTYTTSLFLAANFIILALIRRTAPPWGAIGAILLGFVGIVTVLQPSFSSGDAIPALLCLTVALLDLCVYWSVRFLGKGGEVSWRIVFYFSFFCTIVSAICVPIFEGGFHAISAVNGLCLVCIGLLATLGMLAATRAWMGGNMLLVSCLGFSAIPFSEIISIVWFEHMPSAVSLIGMCIIIVAGIFATIFTKSQEQKNEKPVRASK